MPRYAINFIVEATSQQQAVSLRDRAKAWLEEQEATVLNESVANMDRTYRVVGVDSADEEPFELEVQASDPEAAVAQVKQDLDTRLVAEVREQRHRA